MNICIYVCMCVLYAYIRVCMHLCIDAHMYVCMYICMHVCIHVCIYVIFKLGFGRYGGIVLVGRGNCPGGIVRGKRPGELFRGKCPGPTRASPNSLETYLLVRKWGYIGHRWVVDPWSNGWMGYHSINY